MDYLTQSMTLHSRESLIFKNKNFELTQNIKIIIFILVFFVGLYSGNNTSYATLNSNLTVPSQKNIVKIIEYKDGSKYIGEIVSNKRNGSGTLYYSKSNKEFIKYVGEWKDDKMHGGGVLYCLDYTGKQYTKIGIWENGQIKKIMYFESADGSIHLKADNLEFNKSMDGSVFLGETSENGVIDGIAYKKWSNGEIYLGDWKGNIKDGIGYSVSIDGSIQNGNWENNKFKGTKNDVLVSSKVNEATVNDYEKNKLESIKNIQDLISYLNDNYNNITTPMGKMNLSYKIMENSSSIYAYDYFIETNYSGLTPYDINYSIKFTEEQKKETIELLANHQKSIYNICSKVLPNKKIEGCFYSGFYKYPNVRVGYESIRFFTWANFSPYLGTYYESKLTDFKWYDKANDYNFIPDNNSLSK